MKCFRLRLFQHMLCMMDVLLLPGTLFQNIFFVSSRSAGCVCPVIKYDFSIFLRNSVLANFSFGVQPACIAAALLMLLSFKLTNFPKDFIALVFFIFSPNARDVQALSAALFSFDRERFTSLNPSRMSDASAFRVDSSFCSSWVLSNPRFASIFLVLGLFSSVATTVAFFLGLEGSVSLPCQLCVF